MLFIDSNEYKLNKGKKYVTENNRDMRDCAQWYAFYLRMWWVCACASKTLTHILYQFSVYSLLNLNRMVLLVHFLTVDNLMNLDDQPFVTFQAQHPSIAIAPHVAEHGIINCVKCTYMYSKISYKILKKVIEH